jgi:hypothetical protein
MKIDETILIINHNIGKKRKEETKDILHCQFIKLYRFYLEDLIS